ncbi:hypothetical protein HYH03_018391 [Edaphochlamys debaryana]|uniref:Peptidase S54 rhomboid domain-containing protein n=1 Tax=Edaphochlamys debaryana TaxID=47281 RepID=A0A835XG32_9CHLO|nr:hypothetical protein HYH03_018391 [Edaphochlamys debaryana]|eukprot:KAG2482685.1 hypothetical protein HYH03_018391 [Edaphochlamys debaryana]
MLCRALAGPRLARPQRSSAQGLPSALAGRKPPLGAWSVAAHFAIAQSRGAALLAAHAEDEGKRSTIQSLDDLLGTLSEDEETAVRDDGPRRRRRPRPEAGPKRSKPLYVYVIYYCYICVYLSAAWLEATDGDLAASRLLDSLSNDHLAVAGGELYRLATAGYVCAGGPFELFLQLATLLTVGAELEALMGGTLFWAVYWLAGMTGALADASLSELPITCGPANAAAGMVGALVAFYGRNWGLDERLEEARAESRARRGQLLSGLLGGGGRGTASSRGVGEASRSSMDETETEVEVFPGFSYKFNARLTASARSGLSFLTATVVAGQGLLDVGQSSQSASWIGLLAAFWAGMFLSFGAGPRYEVRYEEPPALRGLAAAQAAAGGEAAEGGPSSSREGGERRAGGFWRPGPEPPPDSDGLKAVDVVPVAQQSAVVGGALGALGAGILTFLAYMDL